jgi:hypothetical protein
MSVASHDDLPTTLPARMSPWSKIKFPALAVVLRQRIH